MSRGRKTIEFDVVVMQQAISKVEASANYTSRDQVYKAAINCYGELGGKNADKLTPILIYQRVKKYGLQVKTPIGKRGNKNLGRKSGEINVREISPANQEHFKLLSKYINFSGFSRSGEMNTPRHKRTIQLVKKIQKGSLKAAISLKCMECTNFQPMEIKECQCKDTCPLFSLRPYQ